LYFDEGKIQLKLVVDMHKNMASFVGSEVLFGIRSEDIYD
jgi:hypothetical protein